MKIHIKAKEDIEKCNNRDNNKIRKKAMTFITFLGLTIVESIYLYTAGASLSGISNNFSIYFGAVLVAVIYFIVIFFARILYRRPFRKEMNTAFSIYKDSDRKDHEGFYNNLLNMKSKPKHIEEIMVFYANISTALIRKGDIDQATQLLDLLDQNAPESPQIKELIRKQKEAFKEILGGSLATFD